MDSNQKEILERVLLMMNYDSSKTLNENTQLITEQYTWPTILQQGLNLSKNNTFSGPEWETYLNGLKATTLPDLMKIQKGFSDAGYGAISPDFGLQGFNKPNPTPASIVLENDIYVKSLKDYQNKEKKGIYAGVKPTGPQSTLIPDIPPQRKNLFGKTSGQLLDELQKQRAVTQQKKTEQKAVASGCIFKNKTEGDAFREWFNNSYPKLAQKNQLDRSGAFCNSYINKIANATFKEGMFKGEKVYDVYKNLTADLSGYDPKSKIPKVDITAQRDKQPSDASKFISQEKQRKVTDQYQDTLTQEEVEMRAYYRDNVFDLSSLPPYNVARVDINNPDCGPWYKEDEWTEPKTKITVNIKCESPGSVLTKLIDLYRKQQATSSPLINQLFSQEEIDYALDNCDQEGVLSFFEEIINGTKRNKDGDIVGKYYRNSKGQSYIAQWNEPKIPCESVFWNKYGLYIQLGGMVAISILSGGLGLGPTSALLAELAADTALNLYSLKKSVEAQDEDAIKMDLAYVFLPLLMASGPVKAALKSAKFGDEVIESVESKLKSLPPNATKTQVDDLLTNMTPQEQRVIKELGTEEYKDVVQNASKDVMDGIKKTADAPIGRKLSNPAINILVYGAPAGSYIYKKLTDIDSILDKNNLAKLSQEEKELWGRALSFLSTQDQDELIGALDNLSADSLENILRTANSEKIIDDYFSSSTTDEERKKNAEKIKRDMKKFVEDLKSDVKNEGGEDLDIEIVIE